MFCLPVAIMISALGQMGFQVRHPLGDTWSFTGSSLCGHPAQEADPRGPLTLSLRSHFDIFQPADACCWVSSLGDLSEGVLPRLHFKFSTLHDIRSPYTRLLCHFSELPSSALHFLNSKFSF